MGLSYLDKAIIFLLPLLVLQIFKDQTEYVIIEYIYSATTVIIPLIDFGLSGYFYYAYRNSKNKDKTVLDFKSAFQRLYLILSALCILIVAVNFFGFEFEKFIIFIVSRLLFILATTFFASYYRLINKPERVLYITLTANIFSLLFLFGFFFLESEFTLWLVFIGQIVFSVFYFIYCMVNVFIKTKHQYDFSQLIQIIKRSVIFSWPTILQVFLMMFIANYGKLSALSQMPINDATLLSVSQRFSMIIFLTHSSLWAFLVKDIYVQNDVLEINKKILIKYLTILTFTAIGVSLVTFSYLFYTLTSEELQKPVLIVSLIIGHTFFSCIFAYLELHYGRENKNIIKLYLAIFGAAVFILLLTFLKINFLERIAIAMFISTLLSLVVSIFVLYKRNYKIA